MFKIEIDYKYCRAEQFLLCRNLSLPGRAPPNYIAPTDLALAYFGPHGSLGPRIVSPTPSHALHSELSVTPRLVQSALLPGSRDVPISPVRHTFATSEIGMLLSLVEIGGNCCCSLPFTTRQVAPTSPSLCQTGCRPDLSDYAQRNLVTPARGWGLPRNPARP